MIYICGSEVARIEMAVNKSYCDKIALGEITIVKCTKLKFLKIDFVFTISDVIVLQIKVVFRHVL
jgi:hypothetical protein